MTTKIFILSCFQLFVFVTLLNAQIHLDSSLVAFYPFNGNALDESGNNNNGTVTGASLISDRFSMPNRAYNFNGFTSRITAPNSASLNITNSISLCVWFRTTNPAIGSTGGAMVAKMKTVNTRQYYMMALDSVVTGDSLYFCVIKTTDAYLRPAVHSTLWDYKWHFMVGTYDFSTGVMKIYVDNALLKTVTVGQFNLEQSTQPLTIGCYVGLVSGFRDFFKGDLDDIRIYSRAINAAEVDALYHENDCTSLLPVSISGLPTTLTVNSSPVLLTGTPAGGHFYGMGMIGNYFNPQVAGVGNHNIVYVFQNTYGCSSAACESVDITLTKIESNNNNIIFKIYPNPANSIITIETNNTDVKTVEFFNMFGSSVLKMKFRNTIDISQMANGIYLMKICDKRGNVLKTEKIVKE